MRTLTRPSTLMFLGLFCATSLLAQPTRTTTTLTAAPPLFRVSSTFRPADGLAAARVESVVFAVYAQESEGTPLWQETQSVAVDGDGSYLALLGSTRKEGLPLELFATGEPRWLGMQFQRAGETEQPRVLLASVPYALIASRAADADTLGGRPASAYLLAGAGVASGASGTAAGGAGATAVAQPAELAGVPKASAGSSGFIGKFTNTTDLGNSVIYENAGRIGLGVTAPLDFMHTRFADPTGSVTGYAVQNMSATAGAYSGMLFFDHNGALAQFQGFNNLTHEYRINNIASGGTINFMLAGSSKFLVRADGDVDIPGSIRKGGVLFLHEKGGSNTAVGRNALPVTTTGYANTAVGRNALQANTIGFSNTAVGNGSMYINTQGNNNTAVGLIALNANTTGDSNTAVGASALQTNTQGNSNTAVGQDALISNNTTGSVNTALGRSALFNVTGSGNIGIGYYGGSSLTSGNDNIAIANVGVAGESGTIRIGAGLQTRAFVAGIRGVTTGGAAVNVVIDTNGQMGTISSSRRFKEDIADMGQASSGLLRLRPVTYRYKQPYADGSKPGDYGLIAEEVAEVYPDLVVKGNDGETETVQYQKLTPMLLNEMQRQNRHAQQQDETIRQLEARIAALESLLSGKVSTLATAGR